MAIIQVNQLVFGYEGSVETVFSGLDFHMDSSWRLGLVGRNGRGKTTLLKLLSGQLKGQGSIISSLPFDYFPFEVDRDRAAMEALVDALAPYTRWERRMEQLLSDPSPENLNAYGEIEQAYASQSGYVIRELLAREVSLMGIDPISLSRPFSTFSPGEQTRLKVASLFLRPGHFLLIDEPTNHLDEQGRSRMADYLCSKSGFLVVSHDRDFLDRVCDHILALEKQGARVVAGNYSVYRENKRLQDEYEQAQQQKLSADIVRLKATAREKAAWSDRVEATKIGNGPCDRGFIGAQAARMMKRAKTIEGRVQRQIEEKEKLLKNLEYTAPIKLESLPLDSQTVLRLSRLSFAYPGSAPLFENLDLELPKGQRLALTGVNGAGKSTLFKLILGQLAPTSGAIWKPKGLVISYLPQTSHHLQGSPWDIAGQMGLDFTRFFMLLRKFDMPQEAFDRDSRGFSLGQKKKLLLALSICQPAHLFLWDEPLNDVDPESREQIEDLLEGTQATIIVIEHERLFLDRIGVAEMSLSGK